MSDFRGLLNSMIIIGSAQAVSILISILRVKVLAVLLGPMGIGLLSIYNSLQGVVSTAAGLGMASSGVREIASVKGERDALSRIRTVLISAHLVQGGVALMAVWLLRERISELLFGDRSYSIEVGLVGLAALLGLMGTAHTAILQGMRKIAACGYVTVLSAFIGTIVGLAAVAIYGHAGLIWFVVVQPLAMGLIAWYFTRKFDQGIEPSLTALQIWQIWKPIAKIGAVFMIAGLVTTSTLLIVRGKITQELGIESAGYFAAAWGISVTYVGFLLTAMGTDYYPRLTEVINDRQRSIVLMNGQIQLALAIGGPILILLIGLAPWVIQALYSEEFLPAVEILQWQVLGNIFKLASWPLGISFIAAARSKTFLVTQINFNVIFLIVLWPGITKFGLNIAGPAFLFAYLLHFFLLNILARSMGKFRWESLSLYLLALHVCLTTSLLVTANFAPMVVAVISPLLALITGIIGLRVVLSKLDNQGRVVKRLIGLYEAMGWPIRPSS